LKYTNIHNYPPIIVEALLKDNYDVNLLDPNIYSVNTLLNPPIIRQLKQRNSEHITIDVSRLLRAKFGTAIHSIFETSLEGYIIEKRRSIKLNGVTLSGKADAYDTNNKIILDFKTCTSASITNPISLESKKKTWEQQLNLYAYIWQTLGFEVKELQIWALLLDYKQIKADTMPNYPTSEAVLIDIPLWSYEKAYKYIKQRLKLHLEAQDGSFDDIPHCSKEERWNKSVFAVHKKDYKRATKLFHKKEKAQAYRDSLIGDFEVIERPGEDIRCKQNYCDVRDFCVYYKNLKL